MNRPITVSRTHRDLVAEGRVSSRFASGTEVSCQPASAWGGEGVKWAGHIRDVSAGGLCLSVDGLSTADYRRYTQNPCYWWAANEQLYPILP